MAEPFLYLDINDAGISAVIGGSEPSDQVYSSIYDGLSDVPENKDKDFSQIRVAIEQLSKEMDISACRHAIVLIPATWVWFRHTNLPFNNEKKIRQVLPLELASCSPDQDSLFLFDFYVLGASFMVDQYLIMSGAMAEEKMDEIFTALFSVGISPKVVAPRGYTHAMAFLEQQAELTNFLYIHIASQDVTLTLIMDRQPLIVRALSAKNLLGVNTHEPDINALAGEIHRTLTGAGLRSDLENNAFEEIDIYMATSDSELKKDHLNSALELKFQDIPGPGPVKSVDFNPWPKTITPGFKSPFVYNFCIGHYKTDTFFSKNRGLLIGGLVLLFIVFGISQASLYRQNTILGNQVERVQKEIQSIYHKTFPNTKKSLVQAPLLLMESKVKQARKTRSTDIKDGFWQADTNVRVLDILNCLSKGIPDSIDIEIVRLVLNHGRLILTGSTGNFNDVDKIKGLMEALPQFKSVNISSAKADKTGKQVLFKFILEI